MSVDKAAPIMVLDSPDVWIDEEVKKNVWTGPLDQAVKMVDTLYNWGRKSSIWPMQFGLACCAIEMIASGGGRFDIARFGSELFRPSPRQADLMIVAGTVTKKMVPAIVRLYNQMAEPKYVLAMGACASAGGPFKEGYNVVSGVDKFVPVDIYVPGCPPTPQALLQGLLMLHRKIDNQSVRDVPWYQAEYHDAIPEPILGPDIFDPRRAAEIKQVLKDDKELEARYIRLASRAELKHGKGEGETAEAKPAARPAASAAKPAAAAGAAKPAASAAARPGGAATKPPSGTTDISAPEASKSAAAAPRTDTATAAPKPTETDKVAASSGMTGKQDPAPSATVVTPEPPKSEAEKKLEENKADANFAQQAEQHHAETAKKE